MPGGAAALRQAQERRTRRCWPICAGPIPSCPSTSSGEVIALAEEFIGLVRDRSPDRLDPWLNQTVRSTLRPLRSFAKHLSADYEAVRAAVTLDWSNGPVEGQINRLKMVKRSMYGRAGLDLLGRRFLLAA
jgi:transposase